ncbi:unnamed protein product [Dovyalis caffra]|uniref:BHLH domain-containing protein n=1 Tax=Dovyalis caffra TaxID=77055 RepID=A0AAV1QRS3_9ROSI|nr:unnamed protein product [Dovyalis caffra]
MSCLIRDLAGDKPNIEVQYWAHREQNRRSSFLRKAHSRREAQKQIVEESSILHASGSKAVRTRLARRAAKIKRSSILHIAIVYVKDLAGDQTKVQSIPRK